MKWLLGVIAMRIEKEHMDLENIDEIRIYNAPKKDYHINIYRE